MLAIKPSPRTPHQPPQSKPLHPNILPCTIHHSGPIKVSKRYWSPKTTTTTTSSSTAPHDHSPKIQTAHFRGRKLQGRRIPLPEGYIGRILQKTAGEEEGEGKQPNRHEATAATAAAEEDEAGEDGKMSGSATVPVRMLETKGTFDALTIWGHEYAPVDGEEGEEEGFARGIGEWIGFAEAVSSSFFFFPPFSLFLSLPLFFFSFGFFLVETKKKEEWKRLNRKQVGCIKSKGRGAKSLRAIDPQLRPRIMMSYHSDDQGRKQGQEREGTVIRSYSLFSSLASLLWGSAELGRKGHGRKARGEKKGKTFPNRPPDARPSHRQLSKLGQKKKISLNDCLPLRR